MRFSRAFRRRAIWLESAARLLWILISPLFSEPARVSPRLVRSAVCDPSVIVRQPGGSTRSYLMSVLVNGFVLGWSVAWPPGPVNAEMIRRGLLPREQGGGFWATWRVGLGACSADFLWAFAVAAGAARCSTHPV